MKRLTKAHWALINPALDACNLAAGQLDSAVESFNTALDEARAQVETTLLDYNEKLAELKLVYEEIATEGRDYWEERSERWQESDAGTAYSEWLDTLESPEGMDEIEIDLPQEIEPPEMQDFTDTEWLPPEEPGNL